MDKLDRIEKDVSEIKQYLIGNEYDKSRSVEGRLQRVEKRRWKDNTVIVVLIAALESLRHLFD